MMQGVVNWRCEAILSLVVTNFTGQREFIEAVIDTGFGGFLSLPSERITRLELPWNTSNTATLGDGSEVLFDFYTAKVIWDGEYQKIDVAASETEPILGMAMLYGYRLQVDTIEGGRVMIEEL